MVFTHTHDVMVAVQSAGSQFSSSAVSWRPVGGQFRQSAHEQVPAVGVCVCLPSVMHGQTTGETVHLTDAGSQEREVRPTSL